MSITQSMQDEMNVLLKFPTDTLMAGLKIHTEAEPSVIAAAQRLFQKGLITNVDGGYLTDAGIDLVDHLSRVHSALMASS